MPPGLRWGSFTLRIPFVHYRAEWPELLQGLTVGSATGFAVVPLYAEHFGMAEETAIALVVLQTLVICSSFLLFGEPFTPGWLTPALPLVLAAASAFAVGPERTEFVNAVVLLTGIVFLLFGLTGLGKWFLRLVPRVLRATIILGAGLSAIYGEFIPRSGGRAARMDASPSSSPSD
jgi:predicted benzoate:H+ symporter BenE